MSDAFRHVVGSVAEPVADWPFEALVAAIERGTLADWRPILTEVRARPDGRVASQVDAYLGYAAPYGVGPLLRRTIDRARDRSAADDGGDAPSARDFLASKGDRDVQSAEEARRSSG